MSNSVFEEKELTPEAFKDSVLDLEKMNLKNIDKEDRKSMVAKIIRLFEEEVKKNDN